MDGLQGLKAIPQEPQLRKPLTYHDRLEGLKSKIFKDSVMEPGFIESLTAPEGSPIDYQNISSVAGGRAREMFVDPMRRFGGAIEKGVTGKPLTIGDQLALIEGMIDTTVGGLFTHGVQKGGFDPNTLHMFVGPKAKDIVKAEKMALRGASPEEIHSKLLMHKKPDGFWRKEISDVEAGFSQVNFEPPAMRYKDAAQRARDAGDDALAFEMERQAKKSSDIDDYEISPWLLTGQKELYEQYPDIATMPTRVTSKLGSEGSYGEGGIDLSIFADDPKKTLYHELQHAVQQREGWARGGSPGQIQARNNYARARIKEIEKTDEYKKAFGKMEKEWNKIKKSSDDVEQQEDIIFEKYKAKHPIIGERESLAIEIGQNYDVQKAYLNLLGEREARDTASRLGLNIEQRRELLPDVGEGSQVLMR